MWNYRGGLLPGLLGGGPECRRLIRIITETIWHSLFARNLCIQEPDPVRLAEHIP